MIDRTPYIIVDNQKISPIERSTGSNSATVGPATQGEQTFGVVDRVTISREAREKARQHQPQNEATPPVLEDLSKKQPATARPLLTYPPKKLTDS